ncbi:SusC/RagA family TonB-linked outer membrane protein [Chitinophaga sancti]|uniref:SusC/RagA family TonB-linked outer membrane protein n=1 Tax=Chitinophaga sancti TaxID=1004 RepID=UPI003F7AAC2C
MKSKQPWTRASMIALIFLPLWTFAQTQMSDVKGIVHSEDSHPVIGATVVIRNTQNNFTTGAKTDTAGIFNMRVPAGGPYLFSISSIGFEPKTYSGYALRAGTTFNLDVSLKAAVGSLDQVVVVGYGTQRKSNLTGAVASLNTENLQQRPVTRVDQALIGQMAGVAVKQTTGTPGKAFSVQVRGAASISAGNEPLYVIDGFPLSTAAPGSSGSFGNGNPMDNINPDDIESIQVLKDAASSAIYGSRGGNGVVLITTKRGKTGKAEISFNANAGYSKAVKKLDVLSGKEWIDRATEMINRQWINSGSNRTATQTNAERRTLLGLPATGIDINYMTDDRWTQAGYGGLKFIDWQDEAFRQASLQNYQLSARGGTGVLNYFLSGNYTKTEGLVKKTDYTLYSVRANFEVKANDRLKLGLNINPSYSITNDPGVEGKDNILHQLVSATPVQLFDAQNVNVFTYDRYPWAVSNNSPLAKLLNFTGATKRFRTLTSVYGDYEILKGLHFKTTVNLDNTDNTSKTYQPNAVTVSSYSTRLASPNAGTFGSLTQYRRQTFVNENTLNYNHNFGKTHDVSLLAGFSYNSDYLYANLQRSSGGFNYSNITTLNGAVAITGNSTETQNKLLSFFGRAQYAYKGKYLLSASLRRDGSSRFGNNTKWAFIPAASIGWNIMDESFMHHLTALSNLKLRVSYGETGNYNIGDYASIALLSAANASLNNTSVAGQTQGSIVNPDLTWEKSQTIDGGIDFGFFNNRISGAIDYYNKVTSSLLLNVPILATTGFQTYLSNAGRVRNTGWEFELNAKVISTKDFSWSLNGNLTLTKNKLVALPNGQKQIVIPSSLGDAAVHSILKVGEPIYSIYVLKRIGVLSQEDINKGVPLYTSETAGDPRYYDANGDGVINSSDRVIVGKPGPDRIWGITSTFQYHNFDLACLVQGQSGGSIYSLLGRAINRVGMSSLENTLGIMRDRWRSAEAPGNGITSKAVTSTTYIASTDWLYSSNYWRVRSITLGYNLGKALKTKQVSAARIYITAENYFGHDRYYGGFNPEAANTDVSGSTSFPEAGDYGGLPLPKSLILGLNITF